MNININPGDALTAAEGLLGLARTAYAAADASTTEEARQVRLERGAAYERVAKALAPSVWLHPAEARPTEAEATDQIAKVIAGGARCIHSPACVHAHQAQVMVPCPCPTTCRCRTTETSFGRCAREGER